MQSQFQSRRVRTPIRAEDSPALIVESNSLGSTLLLGISEDRAGHAGHRRTDGHLRARGADHLWRLGGVAISTLGDVVVLTGLFVMAPC